MPEPVVGPDDVVVAVKACGICGSDLHPYKLGGPVGMILGHELSGDIVKVGSNVADLKEGERVVALPNRSCMECYWCKNQDYLRCPSLLYPGSGVHGALAEYVLIENAKIGLNLIRLPENLSYEVGATVEPLSVAQYSVSKAAIQSEDTVVVQQRRDR